MSADGSEEAATDGEPRESDDSRWRPGSLAADLGFLAAGLGVASAGLPWTSALPFAPVASVQPEPAAFALAATVAFLARRRGLVDRRGALVAGAFAALFGATAFAALVLPAAAGSGAAVDVGVPAGFALAALALAFAVADYASVDANGLGARARTTGLVVGVAFGGLVVAALVASVVRGAIGVLPAPALASTVAGQAASAVGLGLAALAYVALSGREWTYLDVRFDRRAAAWTVGGLVGMFVVLVAASAATRMLGVSGATHSTVEQIRAAPLLGLALVPVSLLLVGPGEELLMRNVVQKGLYEAFSRRGAVVVGCVVFTLVHLPAYASTGGGPAAVGTTLARLFAVSLVLAVVYERTDSVVAAALAHGGYDAVQFAWVYFAVSSP
ncbi:MAG: lysostaphin resistance A-like protein [Halarchaeum sp.]